MRSLEIDYASSSSTTAAPENGPAIAAPPRRGPKSAHRGLFEIPLVGPQFMSRMARNTSTAFNELKGGSASDVTI